MKPLKHMIWITGFSLLAILCGCGDQNDSRISSADVAYLKAARYQALYGSATATSTTTATSTVTITSSTTVTSSSTTTVY
jgi:hypothetical protein